MLNKTTKTVKKRKIILGVTGSVAAYKSADLVRGLIEKGFEVSVIMTRTAENFITPLTLSSLAGRKVYTTSVDMDGEDWKMPHIELAQQTDVVLIAPATANIIAKMAYGFADDLLTSVVLATKAKILIAPAMNTQMYQNSIVQENCRRLKKEGFKIINPIKGQLACGTSGDGHLAEEKDI